MSNFDINSPEFDTYLTVLDSEFVDALDGHILSPGQKVIRSPHNHALVVADSLDHRRKFVELGFAWDEPTRIKLIKANEEDRINIVKKKVDELSLLPSHGNIRSVDIVRKLDRKLGMSVSIVESIFEIMVQTNDYYFGDDSTDATGASCKVIIKRK